MGINNIINLTLHNGNGGGRRHGCCLVGANGAAALVLVVVILVVVAMKQAGGANMGMATAATNCTSSFAAIAQTTLGTEALASSNTVVAFIVGTMNSNVGAKRGGRIRIINSTGKGLAMCVT